MCVTSHARCATSSNRNDISRNIHAWVTCPCRRCSRAMPWRAQHRRLTISCRTHLLLQPHWPRMICTPALKCTHRGWQRWNCAPGVIPPLTRMYFIEDRPVGWNIPKEHPSPGRLPSVLLCALSSCLVERGLKSHTSIHTKLRLKIHPTTKRILYCSHLKKK